MKKLNVLNSCTGFSTVVDLGSWSEKKLDRLIRESAGFRYTGSRVDYISAKFCGTRYMESSLVGGIRTPEKLVINFNTFDCFTYIDSVEALRLCQTFGDIADNLIRIRYRDSSVRYRKRNHFFTDWAAFNSVYVTDKTADIGAHYTRTVCKRLNERKDGSMFVKGLRPIERTIRYIPSRKLDARVLKLLRTGDYIGITTDQLGLDVTHVGILVKSRCGLIFRHASSTAGLVIEQDFVDYIREKQGILVLRPHR